MVLPYTNLLTLPMHAIYRIEDILFLHTFDANGQVDEFRENGFNNKEQLIPFPGPGMFT